MIGKGQAKKVSRAGSDESEELYFGLIAFSVRLSSMPLYEVFGKILLLVVVVLVLRPRQQRLFSEKCFVLFFVFGNS